MTVQQQKVLDRIRKVLAKAEGTDNPLEAEALMAKVNAMLDEHNLELLDVETANEDDPIGTDHDAFHHFVKDSWWKWTVCRAAQLYGAQIVWYKVSKNKTAISVSGRKSARITLELMLPFIRKQIRQRARVYAAEFGVSQAKAERHIANALNSRMSAIYWERKRAEDNRVAAGGRALVPVDLVSAEVDRAHGETRLVKQGQSRTTLEAQQHANQISLHRQTGGTKTAQIGVNR